LHDSPMQARFHSDPRVRATELVLQERLPHLVPLKNPPIEKAEHVPWARQPVAPQFRRYITPHTLSPRTHLLSNGSYAVMLTNAGGGYSRRQALAMTRWREDSTTDAWGSFIYIRDLENGDLWSTAYQPTRREADEYEASFAADRASFRRVDGQIEIRTEIVVSPEDDDLGADLDLAVDAAEAGAVGSKRRFVFIGLAARRLVGGRPEVAVLEIANVDEAAPRVGGGVLAPAGHRQCL